MDKFPPQIRDTKQLMPNSHRLPPVRFQRSRINPLAGDLKRTVLTVFDAHDAFSILTLRLLRSGGAPNHEATPPSSSPPPTAPAEAVTTARRNGHFPGGASRGGDATEDWTIVSGGGDGAVAHWSVVGLASPHQVADGAEEAGVELHKIGDYEVRAVAYAEAWCRANRSWKVSKGFHV